MCQSPSEYAYTQADLLAGAGKMVESAEAQASYREIGPGLFIVLLEITEPAPAPPSAEAERVTDELNAKLASALAAPPYGKTPAEWLAQDTPEPVWAVVRTHQPGRAARWLHETWAWVRGWWAE